MCYLCSKDPIFDIIEKLYPSNEAKNDRIRARAIKDALNAIEENKEHGLSPCDGGKQMVFRMKQEQYRLARRL